MSFLWSDCYPVKVEDMLRSDPKEGKFMEDCWGKGEKGSFRNILKGAMATHGNCGRGRGGRFEEDQWGASRVVESGISLTFCAPSAISAAVWILPSAVAIPSSWSVPIWSSSCYTTSWSGGISMKSRGRDLTTIRLLGLEGRLL
jgi:hypothetical protein